MSVRLGLLVLLAEEPMHGYQLRQQFERRTGGTWPLNIGQVYTTVRRLVRDGLVEPTSQGEVGSVAAAGEGPDETVGTDGTDGVEQFRLTDAGRAEVDAWWCTPVERGAPARDELVIKLALAVTSRGADGSRPDVRDVVQRQRSETMRALHDYTRLKTGDQPAAGGDLAWSLVLDHLIFSAEAELRWLDHVEARVARAVATPEASLPAASPADATSTHRAEERDAERTVR